MNVGAEMTLEIWKHILEQEDTIPVAMLCIRGSHTSMLIPSGPLTGGFFAHGFKDWPPGVEKAASVLLHEISEMIRRWEDDAKAVQPKAADDGVPF